MRPHSVRRSLLVAALIAAGCSGNGGGGGTPGDDDDDGAGPNPGNVEVPTSNGPKELLPDLTVNEPLLGASWYLQNVNSGSPNNECAVYEGCFTGTGTRRLLRFSVGVVNRGPVDLVIGDPNGNSENFEYSPCHGHYHFKNFANYELSDANGVIATGRKQAFCLMDYDDFGAPGPGGQQFDCGFQGISVDWQDIYEGYLDCQWIDVTGVPPGEYTLRVTVNTDHKIPEAGPYPNVGETSVTIH